MVKTQHLITIPILIVLSTVMFGEVKSKTIVADYTFYFGGFTILQAETTIELRRKSYKVVSKSKTDGLLNVFYEWSGQATSQGNFLEWRSVPVSIKTSAKEPVMFGKQSYHMKATEK